MLWPAQILPNSTQHNTDSRQKQIPKQQQQQQRLRKVWGDPNINSLTPANSYETEKPIPTVLVKDFQRTNLIYQIEKKF